MSGPEPLSVRHQAWATPLRRPRMSNDEDTRPGRARADAVEHRVDLRSGLGDPAADLVDVDSNVKGGAVLAASAGCESQSIAPVGRLPNVALAAKVIRAGHGRALVKLRCMSTLRLQRLDRTELARGRFAIRKGKRATLSLRLRRSARSGPVQIFARQRDTDGRPKLTVARARLRAR